MMQRLNDASEPANSSSPLMDLVVTYDVTLVKAESQEIHVELEFNNEGSEVLELRNPFEFVQFQLLNSEGFPLTLSSKTSSIRRHNPDNKSTALEDPYPVIVLFENDEDTDLEQLNNTTWEMHPDTTYRAVYKLDHYLKDGQQVELDADKYQIRVTLSIINANDSNDSRILVMPSPTQVMA